MKITPSQSSSRRDGRQAILTAALELFTQRGYEETSVEDLRKAAGFKSKASLYAHFINKEAIAKALTTQVMEQLERQMLHAYAQAKPDPLKILTATTRAFVRWGFMHPTEYTFRFVRNQQEKMIRGQFDYGNNAFSEVLPIMLSLMQDLRQHYPVRQIADTALLSTSAGLVSRAIIDPSAFGDISFDEQVEQVVELCMGIYFSEPVSYQ